ncbi:MAG: PH domain-containing protein [Candidatus Thorarchaeota archaeon]
MSSSSVETPTERECLIAKYSSRRLSSLIYYVIGTILFSFGYIFMITSSASIVDYNITAWYLGLFSMSFGSLIMVIAELRRRYSLYIITTWNVRTRTGFWNKTTARVYYDDIERIEVDSDPEEVKVNQGDVLIFVKGEADPAIIFDAIAYPLGALEIIRRFKETIPDPIPWSHLDKTRIAPF